MFGANETNVEGNPVNLDDDNDDADADGGKMSSSYEMVKMKKPKKGFIENEVVFTDNEMEIETTLKNNIGENLEKVQEEDLNISKILDSSDKDEVCDTPTDKKINDIRSKYQGIFVHDGNNSECGVNSEHDVHGVGENEQCDSLSSPPPTYIADMKIDNRVLAAEKKHYLNPGWKRGCLFPIDNRGLGEHCNVIEQMSTDSDKDRQLLQVLDEVITRNNAAYEIDDGNNDELEGQDDFEGEIEDKDDHDHEDKNKNENENVDKSHSLDLESQQDSHTETNGYGDSNEETHGQQVPIHDVTSQKQIETDSVNVDRDVCTQRHDRVNDKEADSVVTEESDVTSTVVDQCGKGDTDNLIVIEPTQANKDSINSHSGSTDSTNREQHFVYDINTGMAYDICDLNLSSFCQLFLIDSVTTPTGIQYTVTAVQLTTGTAIGPPDTPTTATPSLMNITDQVTPAAPVMDNLPSLHIENCSTVPVDVTPEKHAGEVHVLKVVIEDIDLDVHMKKEPCSDNDDITEHDGQLEQKDQNNNEKCDTEEQKQESDVS